MNSLRSRLALALALALGVSGTPRDGAAEVLAEEGVRLPLIMLAVDTSGSMEYEDDVAAIVPSCPEDGPFRRNRWALALETLTGSFESYTCSLDLRVEPPGREDLGYPIPHVVYEVSQQARDGLIDLYADSVKFAFATYDTVWDPSPGIEGGWSYGAARAHPLLGPISVGIKNADATAANESHTGGALRKFFPGDGPASAVRAANLALEQALFATIPYGGTPIAPMLSDIHEYFTTDPALQPYDAGTGTGDPFYQCRPRFTILITDGVPTQGEGVEEGYDTSPQAASDLYSSHPMGVKTYVIGYALGGAEVPLPLDAIAQAGDPDCLEPPCAFIANNQSELLFALGQIIGEILTGSHTRTSAVFTNVTRNPNDAQYQFNTGWGQVPVNPIDRQGFLERVTFRCETACQTPEGGAGPCELQSVSTLAINEAPLPAPIFLQHEAQLVQLAKSNPLVTPEMLGVPTDGSALNPDEPPVPLMDLRPAQPYIPGTPQRLGEELLGMSDDETARQEYKDQLIDLIMAAPGSRREGFRMGAIRYGTPAILDPPLTGISQRPSYAEYQEAQRERPTVLFAPTHLGELMAIRIDRGLGMSNESPGQHLWSFIPAQLTPKLAAHASVTQFLMDSPTVVRNVLLERGAGAVDPVEESTRWRAVLLQGYRDGGRGYFALDVSDPFQPQFMWEIDPERRCFAGDGSPVCQINENSDADDFCHLGFSYAQPVVGNVFLNTSLFPNQERAVALLAGGRYDAPPAGAEPGSCGTSQVFEESDIGRGVFVVDLATGMKLSELGRHRGNVPQADLPRLVYDFTSPPRCFNTGTDAVMTRCFIGDAGGQMWRIDLASGDPDTWRMVFFYDPYDLGGPLTGQPRGPIASPPALAFDDVTGRMTVIWGTGGPEALLSAGEAHGVFSVSERLLLDASGLVDPASDVQAELNWAKTFEDGTMVMGEPVVFDEVAYFTTYRTNPEDACVKLPEAARLWGLDYVRSTSLDPEQAGDPLAGLVLDPEQPDVKVEFLVLEEDGLPAGPKIITRPSCVGDEALQFDPFLGTLGGSGAGPSAMGGGGGGPGATEIVVQQSPGAAPVGTTSAGIPRQVQSVQVGLMRPRSTLFPLSWALVFD